MLFSTVSVFLASALVVPSSLASPLSTFKLPDADVVYWIGSFDCGEPNVTTNGTVAIGECRQIHLPSLKIQEQKSTTCTYVQFEGLGCSGPAISATYIQAGLGFSTCIPTGVYDGGTHIQKSALYIC